MDPSYPDHHVSKLVNLISGAQFANSLLFFFNFLTFAIRKCIIVAFSTNLLRCSPGRFTWVTENSLLNGCSVQDHLLSVRCDVSSGGQGSIVLSDCTPPVGILVSVWWSLAHGSVMPKSPDCGSAFSHFSLFHFSLYSSRTDQMFRILAVFESYGRVGQCSARMKTFPSRSANQWNAENCKCIDPYHRGGIIDNQLKHISHFAGLAAPSPSPCQLLCLLRSSKSRCDETDNHRVSKGVRPIREANISTHSVKSYSELLRNGLSERNRRYGAKGARGRF